MTTVYCSYVHLRLSHHNRQRGRNDLEASIDNRIRDLRPQPLFYAGLPRVPNASSQHHYERRSTLFYTTSISFSLANSLMTTEVRNAAYSSVDRLTWLNLITGLR